MCSTVTEARNTRSLSTAPRKEEKSKTESHPRWRPGGSSDILRSTINIFVKLMSWATCAMNLEQSRMRKEAALITNQWASREATTFKREKKERKGERNAHTKTFRAISNICLYTVTFFYEKPYKWLKWHHFITAYSWYNINAMTALIQHFCPG